MRIVIGRLLPSSTSTLPQPQPTVQAMSQLANVTTFSDASRQLSHRPPMQPVEGFEEH
jgi:hypothetical protein